MQVMQTGAFLTQNQRQVQEAFYKPALLDLKESSAVENGKRISIGPVEVTEVCNKHQSFTHIILVLSHYSFELFSIHFEISNGRLNQGKVS